MRIYRILLNFPRSRTTTCLILPRNIHTLSKCNERGQEKIDDWAISDLQWTKWWDGDFGKHPGKCNLPAVSLPNNMQESITEYLTEYYELEDRTKVITVCEKLCRILYSRPLQINPERLARAEPPKKGISKKDLETFYNEETINKKLETKQQASREEAWKQIVYDRLMCAAYLIGRTPAAYAASLRVLTEIKKRRPNFQPQTMLDYGSGTGTAVWAANSLWGSTLTEFLCVDWSNVMNELARFIFTAGNTDSELMGIHLRPILPVSFKNKYDIVIAAYTLSELPSEKLRLTTLKLLWEKTNDYLILIEQGNLPGYHMMMEARNLLTEDLCIQNANLIFSNTMCDCTSHSPHWSDKNPNYMSIEGADMTKTTRLNRAIETGHVFAPCPHATFCPKWKSNSICAFKQKYIPPTYSRRFNKMHTAKTEKFTYMILTKKEPEEDNAWPRAIKNPSKINSKCTQCHYCMPSGEIQHCSITRAKCSRDLLYAARKTSLGDLLPFNSLQKK